MCENNYDDQHINKARLLERVISGMITTGIGTTLIIVAKLLGVIG
jgi:hypothetical protein